MKRAPLSEGLFINVNKTLSWSFVVEKFFMCSPLAGIISQAAIKRKKGSDSLREYLRELRKKADMSQAAVAEKLGISQNYYSTIETGDRQKNIDLSIVVRLAEIFGVSVEWIAEQERRTIAKNKEAG